MYKWLSEYLPKCACSLANPTWLKAGAKSLMSSTLIFRQPVLVNRGFPVSATSIVSCKHKGERNVKYDS